MTTPFIDPADIVHLDPAPFEEHQRAMEEEVVPAIMKELREQAVAAARVRRLVLF